MHSNSSIVYTPLIDHDSEGGVATSKTKSLCGQLRSILFSFLFIGSLILNVVLISFTSLAHDANGPRVMPSKFLYSPAQDAIRYETIKFHSGFGSDLPIYDQPPSPEVDAAWESLYEFALNKVPRNEAALMANKTYPILGEEDHYMIALDVFHELHCLNEMRKAMYPEYYPVTDEGIHTPHMRHCISSLRQSIACSADITPIVWQWSERSQAAKERSDVVHSCRDFQKLKSWAENHFVPLQQNMSVYIEDDLEIPTFR